MLCAIKHYHYCYHIASNLYIQSTASCIIHLQFSISANALEIRAVQSLKCKSDVLLTVHENNLFYNHRLSINRSTKRGKEKSPSDGHCQCEKEMDDYLLACQQIFEKVPHSATHVKERPSFLKLNDINDI
jgi:hypothetical protein